MDCLDLKMFLKRIFRTFLKNVFSIFQIIILLKMKIFYFFFYIFFQIIHISIVTVIFNSYIHIHIYE